LVPLERGLPAKNDNAVDPFNRGAWFAGKSRSNEIPNEIQARSKALASARLPPH